mmetsp:Transcript_7640/g.15500  ORF Transcript_7640/g.15500 Transcript_7640/m.15500 type:complete len:85 (-) Transcript_7640:1974-2228(-)
MSAEEKQHFGRLRAVDRQRLADKAGVDMKDVEEMLTHIKQHQALQLFIKKVIKQGRPLPRTSREMQMMMMDPHSGMPRRMKSGR